MPKSFVVIVLVSDMLILPPLRRFFIKKLEVAQIIKIFPGYFYRSRRFVFVFTEGLYCPMF